jgi:hypothetical protein
MQRSPPRPHYSPPPVRSSSPASGSRISCVGYTAMCIG